MLYANLDAKAASRIRKLRFYVADTQSRLAL